VSARQELMGKVLLPLGTTWSMEMVWLIANGLDYEAAKIPQEQRFPHIE